MPALSYALSAGDEEMALAVVRRGNAAAGNVKISPLNVDTIVEGDDSGELPEMRATLPLPTAPPPSSPMS